MDWMSLTPFHFCDSKKSIQNNIKNKVNHGIFLDKPSKDDMQQDGTGIVSETGDELKQGFSSFMKEPKASKEEEEITTHRPDLTQIVRLPDPSVCISYRKPLKRPATCKADRLSIIDEEKEEEWNDNEYKYLFTKANDLKTKVSFKETTTCIEVPSHHDYGSRSRKKLWDRYWGSELRQEQCRLEFQADGKDWRNCTEEEDMAILENGELVHPITYWTMYGTCYNPPPPEAPTVLESLLGLKRFLDKRGESAALLKEEEESKVDTNDSATDTTTTSRSSG